jgi:type IV pilus assembly protein PilN
MIRINLLPFRAARKKENIKRQISIFMGIVVVFLLGSVYGYINLSGTLGDIKGEQKKLQADLKTYESTIKKIDRLNKKIKEIRAKLNVIKDLEKGKTGPVRLLDELANAVPKDKLWLRSYNEKAGKLTLSGTAMDNETVALFMTRLEATQSITSVDLRNAKLRRVKSYGLDVSDFVLDCTTYAFKKKEPPKKTKKKRKKKK